MVVTKEMIEAFIEDVKDGYADVDDFGNDDFFIEGMVNMRDALTAALAVAPGVEVKPLEWVEHWGGADDDLPSWRGKNPLGLHVSVDFIGKYKLERHSDAPQDELAAAKSAAQADYTARIMSALATTETNGHE